ncbi:amidohydrolase [Herpetosiphon geysericola]|uniref:Amidohydrolase 3 domain-containing protein n=1 Tax=Herpetosiphon geysericola TaxID=70996 RepID=A0A0P6YLM8_9CHLR|nr:amidohydrolase [Herpetosiphon geysericola]KPL90932.1 hypothetical protein SE18_03930 [Herpetosiphon geysericola]
MARDRLIAGGAIWTLDPTVGVAEAIALRDGKVVTVGTNAEVRAALHADYEYIDLAGRSVVPGICDAHIHLLWSALLADQIDLQEVASFDHALEIIRQHAERLPADAWVLGSGWDHSLWQRDWPTASELDQVTGGRPAFITRKDLHSAWVNNAALNCANISKFSSDPDGGSIGRDATGEPNGMLFENGQLAVKACIPEPSAAQKETSIQAFIKRMHQRGITSIHVPEGPDCFAAVQTLYGRGALEMRILHHLRMDLLEHAVAMGLKSGLGDAWLRFGNLKIFSDGSLGSATAHMLEPFDNLPANAPHPYGIPMHDREDLFATIDRALANDISVIMHAIGDAANRTVLDAIEAALKANPESLQPSLGKGALAARVPNRIEHAQLLHPADIRRFGQLGVIASMQPIHATSDISVADRFWGQRAQSAYAWRSLQASGAILAFGSDAPVESWDPWAGIHAAVTRQRPDGSPDGGWYPEQRLSLEEALWAYTVGPAITSGEQAIKGSLGVGKLADLVILEEDLAQVAPQQLAKVQVAQTIIEGQTVWEG